MFELVSTYEPAGDQPQAIAKLAAGLDAGAKHQTLLGVTGSGKTFTIANVIAKVNGPTLERLWDQIETPALRAACEADGALPL